MDPKRNDGLEEELDLQALLDKYLPDEKDDAGVPEVNEATETPSGNEELDFEECEITPPDK